MLNLLRFRAIADYSATLELAPRSPIGPSEALGSAGDADALGRLNEKFYERPEDLASLVMRHLARPRRKLT